MAAHERFLNFRLKDPLKSRIEAFENSTGVSATSISGHLLEAAMDYFEEHGNLPIPLAVMSKSALDEAHEHSSTALAETSLAYGTARAADLLVALADQLGVKLEAKPLAKKQPARRQYTAGRQIDRGKHKAAS